MKITERLRLTQVKRYPICHTNRDQSVAEHTFGVLIIARELALVLKDPEYLEAITDYAIVHDMDEVFTGDIPSGFKRRLRAECPEVIRILDPEHNVNDVIKGTVKLADYLEAMYHLMEYGGSRFANRVLDDITENFMKELQNEKTPAAVRQRAEAIWRSM